MSTRIVHAHIFAPHKSIFKSMRNSRATAYTVRCSRAGDCPLLPKGQCIARGAFDACMYGREAKVEGFTTRARKYHDWIADQRKRLEGIPSLEGAPRKVCRVGDHVWLPYSHMAAAISGKTSFVANWQDKFLPAAEFTAAMVVRLCNARPHALFGGEIKTYQSESVPKFVAHMREEFPELLAEAAAQDEHLRSIIKALTAVGRKALLKSLVPNVGVYAADGPNTTWAWDGESLVATEPTTYVFQRIPGRISIVPNDDAVVTVTDDAQVGPQTVFVD